jgi:hypothetical protein
MINKRKLKKRGQSKAKQTEESIINHKKDTRERRQEKQ